MSISLMVDIETIGTDSNAGIISIGAVPFTLDGDKRVSEIPNFYVKIDPTDARFFGSRTAATMEWWATQPQEVLDEAFSGKARYPDTMRLFAAYVNEHNFTDLWGNGANFDCVLIRSAMKAVGVEPTWAFYQEMCVRTLLDLTHTKRPPAAMAHHPISDCESQIAGVIAAYGILQAGMDVQE